MHKTAAWPLAIMYAVLAVYASLYPFAEWRDQGIVPWEFLWAPVSHYWTGFDVAINVVGYMPLGGLLALALMRGSRSRHPVYKAWALAAVLSLCMESAQSYLPSRVPSREDFLLNMAGAWLGAVSTLVLERLGAINRWSEIRSHWFVEPSRGGMVLLATWPLALLFPASVPFGLGQVLERVMGALSEQFQGSVIAAWLPMGVPSLHPLMPASEMVCVALGLIIPCLVGFCVVRKPSRRAMLVVLVVLAGTAATSLSAALTWGPSHAWAWYDAPAQAGMGAAVVIALAMAVLPWRAAAGLVLLALGVYLSLLNQAPENPYFAQTLQQWEQGRFIRFNGLSQWLGWLWPYVASVYVFGQIGRRESKN
jgi:VanZ family protein